VFSKRHRFHGRGSLKGVYGRGKQVRGSLISLKYSQRGTDRPYRVAVVVSRKVSKSAVRRNRIRRRIYEQVRLAKPEIKAGTDLVLTAYGEQLAEIEAPNLKSHIDELLAKAGPDIRV
jgi:ribonuclease P protein component